MRGILGNVTVGVITAATIAVGTLLWNWASEGGVARLFGGITESDVRKLILDEMQVVTNERLDDVIAGLGSGGQAIIPEPGGNGQTIQCPDGSVMVGALYQSDPGGRGGIISWIGPVCRDFRTQ